MTTASDKGSAEIDRRTHVATRGLLIVLIVIGHNRVLHDHFYHSVYNTLYTFHVGAFFLLAALAPPRRLNAQTCKSLFKRIFLPFMIAATVYSVAAAVMGITAYRKDGALVAWLVDTATALVVANTWILDAVTGLKMLWFLPAFTVFCLIYNVSSYLSANARKAAFGVLVLIHITIGMLGPEVCRNIPFDINTVLYILAPAMLFRAIGPVLLRKNAITFACMLAFVAASLVAYYNKFEVVLSDSVLPHIGRPLALFIADVQLVCGTVGAMYFARMLRDVRFVKFLGENALIIYLVHPAFNVLAMKALKRLAWPAAMVAISSFALSMSILVSWALGHTKLRFKSIPA